MGLPMLTNVGDIDTITNILSSKIKEISESEARKINKQAFSEDNIFTFTFLGIIQKDDKGIKLSEAGREYVNQTSDELKVKILKLSIKKINIYDTTLEYMHHNQKLSPTKTEIGAYWNENFNDKVTTLTESQISSAVIFFLKLLEKVNLGKFINAGRGRETRIDFDNVELAEYVTLKLSKNDISNKVTKSEKKEIKPSKDTNDEESIESTVDVIENKSEMSPSSLRALGKLEIGLSWKELGSDGAKKLILEKLDDLQQENTVLKAKVEKFYAIDKRNAVLEEKIETLSNINLTRTSVNSIGGIILGASFTITELTPRVIGIVLGLILLVLSLVYREKSSREPEKIQESK